MTPSVPTSGKPEVWRLVRTTLITALVLVVYGVAYRGAEINFGRLFGSLPKGGPLLRSFLTPDLLRREIKPVTLDLAFPVPCGSAAPEQVSASGPRLVASVPCAAPRDTFTVEGFALAPNTELQLRWRLPGGQYYPGPFSVTDAAGHFAAQFEARPIVATQNGVPSKVEVQLLVPVGGLKPSATVYEVLDAIIVTLFMALLATTFAVVVSAPLSFLAARNVTGRHPFGAAVYTLTRTFFDVFRSYEPIILATLFAFWVGFGPFAGAIALSLVTIASLGKLYSEAVENIDLGPVEALAASGANKLQVVLYAIVPQVIPDYLSYTIYHWDINVRVSTIIGYVGGGGIGYYLSQMINTSQYNKAGTAIWAIIAVVWAMDFLSAAVRKRFA